MALRLLQAVLLSLSLIGCSQRQPEVSALPAETPIKESDEYANKQDAAIEKAAGYVAVAKEENKKAPDSEPKKNVDVLLEAASSYLDKPKAEDINQAKALATDHKRIEAVKADAEKTIKSINDAWEQVVKESERRRVEAEQNLKRAQMELDAAAKREEAHLLGMLGAGLIAVGTLLLIFGHIVGISKFGAVAVIASGAGTAALPRLFDSPYFVYGALSLVGVAGVQMLIALGKRLFIRGQNAVDSKTDAGDKPDA
jgi:chemotaxis protein histidine kinase CheA